MKAIRVFLHTGMMYEAFIVFYLVRVSEERDESASYVATRGLTKLYLCATSAKRLEGDCGRDT